MEGSGHSLPEYITILFESYLFVVGKQNLICLSEFQTASILIFVLHICCQGQHGSLDENVCRQLNVSYHKFKGGDLKCEPNSGASKVPAALIRSAAEIELYLILQPHRFVNHDFLQISMSTEAGPNHKMDS